MAQTTTIHIALAPEAKAQLDALAEATRRPAEHLAAEAIAESGYPLDCHTYYR